MSENVARKAEEKAEGPTWEEISPYVDEALAELPGELQQAVILHYLDGQTQEDIAAQCGVNQSTISRRIEKGVEALQSVLRKRGVIASAAFLGALLSQRAAEAVPVTLHVALGKMAIAGIGKASATSSSIIGGWSMAKAIGITAVLAGVVVAGGILVHQMSKEPVPSTAPAAAVQPPTETAIDQQLTRLKKAISDSLAAMTGPGWQAADQPHLAELMVTHLRERLTEQGADEVLTPEQEKAFIVSLPLLWGDMDRGRYNLLSSYNRFRDEAVKYRIDVALARPIPSPADQLRMVEQMQQIGAVLPIMRQALVVGRP